MSTVASTTIEEVRARHKVVLVSGAHEGSPVNTIPPGFYGFTFSPASFEAPIFSRNSFLSFEVHRTESGPTILAFAEPAVAASLESAPGTLDIDLHPVPKDTFTTLVLVPHARIAQAKPLDRAHSNRLRLTVRPA